MKQMMLGNCFFQAGARSRFIVLLMVLWGVTVTPIQAAPTTHVKDFGYWTVNNNGFPYEETTGGSGSDTDEPVNIQNTMLSVFNASPTESIIYRIRIYHHDGFLFPESCSHIISPLETQIIDFNATIQRILTEMNPFDSKLMYNHIGWFSVVWEQDDPPGDPSPSKLHFMSWVKQDYHNDIHFYSDLRILPSAARTMLPGKKLDQTLYVPSVLWNWDCSNDIWYRPRVYLFVTNPTSEEQHFSIRLRDRSGTEMAAIPSEGVHTVSIPASTTWKGSVEVFVSQYFTYNNAVNWPQDPGYIEIEPDPAYPDSHELLFSAGCEFISDRSEYFQSFLGGTAAEIFDTIPVLDQSEIRSTYLVPMCFYHYPCPTLGNIGLQSSYFVLSNPNDDPITVLASYYNQQERITLSGHYSSEIKEFILLSADPFPIEFSSENGEPFLIYHYINRSFPDGEDNTVSEECWMPDAQNLTVDHPCIYSPYKIATDSETEVNLKNNTQSPVTIQFTLYSDQELSTPEIVLAANSFQRKPLSEFLPPGTNRTGSFKMELSAPPAGADVAYQILAIEGVRSCDPPSFSLANLHTEPDVQNQTLQSGSPQILNYSARNYGNFIEVNWEAVGCTSYDVFVQPPNQTGRFCIESKTVPRQTSILAHQPGSYQITIQGFSPMGDASSECVIQHTYSEPLKTFDLVETSSNSKHYEVTQCLSKNIFGFCTERSKPLNVFYLAESSIDMMYYQYGYLAADEIVEAINAHYFWICEWIVKHGCDLNDVLSSDSQPECPNLSSMIDKDTLRYTKQILNGISEKYQSMPIIMPPQRQYIPTPAPQNIPVPHELSVYDILALNMLDELWSPWYNVENSYPVCEEGSGEARSDTEKPDKCAVGVFWGKFAELEPQSVIHTDNCHWGQYLADDFSIFVFDFSNLPLTVKHPNNYVLGAIPGCIHPFGFGINSKNLSMSSMASGVDRLTLQDLGTYMGATDPPLRYLVEIFRLMIEQANSTRDTDRMLRQSPMIGKLISLAGNSGDLATTSIDHHLYDSLLWACVATDPLTIHYAIADRITNREFAVGNGGEISSVQQFHPQFSDDISYAGFDILENTDNMYYCYKKINQEINQNDRMSISQIYRIVSSSMQFPDFMNTAFRKMESETAIQTHFVILDPQNNPRVAGDKYNPVFYFGLMDNTHEDFYNSAYSPYNLMRFRWRELFGLGSDPSGTNAR